MKIVPYEKKYRKDFIEMNKNGFPKCLLWNSRTLMFWRILRMQLKRADRFFCG